MFLYLLKMFYMRRLLALPLDLNRQYMYECPVFFKKYFNALIYLYLHSVHTECVFLLCKTEERKRDGT